MRAREFLKSLKKLNGKIRSLEFKLETLETRAIGITGIDYSKDAVQTSPSGVPAIDAVITEITETRTRLEKLQKAFDERKCEILLYICRIENKKYIELLTMCYLDFMSFGEIAEQMHYTEQTLKNIHSEAIREFEKVNKSSLLKKYPKST